jgi:tetratricopeptide (TPR) repeat protein
MKEHFDLGMAALNGTKQARDEMMQLPADQRGPAKEKLDALYATAVTEFETAKKAAPEKDPNLHLIYYQQGVAYDQSGKTDEAIASYKKAIELKPTEAGYYNNLGNVYARSAKFQEAQQAYQKSVDLDPSKATSVWLNYGISLYNANRLKEAVDPLRKATSLDPKNANAWYLLGASLLASIDSKKEGDKIISIVQPGTAEAYQKYLELAPTGHFAEDAKAALVALESLGAGIDTKVKVTTKPKKKP